MNPKLVELAFVPEVHVETNDVPKSDFLGHRWCVNRWSRNYRCAGGATSAALRRNQGKAGFVQGGSQTGDGLFVDCIVPILKGRPQPRRATKPLPEIICSLLQLAKCRIQILVSGALPRCPRAILLAPGPAAEPAQVAPARRRNAQPSQANEPPAQAISPLQGMPAPRANEGRIDEE